MAGTVPAADDRALGAGSYLAGLGELALIAAGIGWIAYRLRRRLLPGWNGSPARVAEAVLAAATLLLISEALGAAGWFGEWGLIAAVGLVAAATSALPLPSRPGEVPPAPAPERRALPAVAAACAVVVAAWAVPTLASLGGGMVRADTLWYHMPLATRFAQTGSLDAVFYFDPVFYATFYPANSEVFHAVPILALGRDFLSPFLNLGWLVLGLTASYAIGRPYRVGAQALLGGACVLGAQMLVEFQAGEALNDVTGVAFVLAAVALVVNGRAAGGGRDIAPAALATAGLAAGIAAGTKLSFLAPVAALTLVVIAVAPAGRRLRSGAVWIAPLLALCAYWYVRNVVATGNPVPFVHSIGPLDLPSPERALEQRPGFAVAHYWDEPGVWKDWFVPGLHESFGFLWPATMLAMAGGGAYALWRGREPLLRGLGAVSVFAIAAYLFTPLTAAGEQGAPVAFVWNVRYLAPAAAISLTILPCLPPLRGTERARTGALVGLGMLALATSASLIQWRQGELPGALAVGACVLGGFALWLRARPARPRMALLAAVGGFAALLAAGFFVQRSYLEDRYESSGRQLDLHDAFRWAQGVSDSSIALGGVRAAFNQYPFYGADLSNRVQWVGRRGPHDAWLRIRDCAGWRRALNEGGYDYAVTTYDPFTPGALTDTKEAAWTRGDPGARQILRDGPVSVFAIRRRLHPDGCGALPRLSAAELDGESMNSRPLANQPPRSAATSPRSAAR